MQELATCIYFRRSSLSPLHPHQIQLCVHIAMCPTYVYACTVGFGGDEEVKGMILNSARVMSFTLLRFYINLYIPKLETVLM